MFGDDPTRLNLFIAVYFLAIYGWMHYRRFFPKPTQMQKVVDWEAVAKLEHEFGIPHLAQSAKACPDNTSHIEDMTLAELVDAAQEAVDRGVYTANDRRLIAAIASLIEAEERRPVLNGSGVETLTRALSLGLMGPNEFRSAVATSKERKITSAAFEQHGVRVHTGGPINPAMKGYVLRLNEHTYPRPGEPGYPPRPPSGNAGGSP